MQQNFANFGLLYFAR